MKTHFLSKWLRPPAPNTWIWSGVLCSAFTAALYSPQKPNQTFDTICAGLVEAKNVVVLAPNRTRIELGVLNYGADNCSAALMLRDEIGMKRAVLRLFYGGPRLEMDGADGEHAFDLWTRPEESSGLRFIHDKGPRLSVMSHAEKGSSAFFTDENGRQTAYPK